MENLDKKVDIKVSTHWENLLDSISTGTLTSQPNFKSWSVFAVM